jgi:hypothetical protein
MRDAIRTQSGRLIHYDEIASVAIRQADDLDTDDLLWIIEVITHGGEVVQIFAGLDPPFRYDFPGSKLKGMPFTKVRKKVEAICRFIEHRSNKSNITLDLSKE